MQIYLGSKSRKQPQGRQVVNGKAEKAGAGRAQGKGRPGPSVSPRVCLWLFQTIRKLSGGGEGASVRGFTGQFMKHFLFSGAGAGIT